MSTKESFLNDLKDILYKYKAECYSINVNSVPGKGINNLPNKAITGFKLPIPNEDVGVIVSGKDIYDFVGYGK